MEVDLVGSSDLGGKAASAGSDNAEGMCFVEEQERPVLFLELDDFPERRAIAVHTEDRLGDDENAATGWSAMARPLKMLIKLVEMVVGKDAHGRTGEAGAVDEGGVA